MIYSKFQGKEISALGMGCMRFPVQADGKIDKVATRELIDYALKNGVNYFDTAFMYHGGESELVVGEILKDYPRESFYLASKFPGWEKKNMGKTEEIFEKQLEKCQVDYFDFYLFHNVSDGCIDEYLDEKYGTHDYLIKQKRKGRIRHLGFSTHASNENFLRFLDAYGDDMEFCQIQLNWWDWDFQDAKTKVRILRERNIPVWVMEPVRGGSLASLPVAYESELKKLRPNASMAEWAFRFLQSIPEVAVTLSGMSNFAQLQENIQTYRETAPLNEREKSTLFSIAKAMTDANRLPCTACRYCVEHCPMSLEIPSLIDLYNEYAHASGGVLAPNAIRALDEDKRPSACVGCRACEKVCPQNIKISEMMQDFTAKLQ